MIIYNNRYQFYFMPNIKKDPEHNSPERVYQEAQNYRKSMSTILTKQSSKKSQCRPHHLDQIVCIISSNVSLLQMQEQTDMVRFSIDHGKYTNTVFRTLEHTDQSSRDKVRHKLEKKEQMTKKNSSQIQKKMAQQAQKYNKHFNEVHKKYQTTQQNKKLSKESKALSLRKQLIDFQEKETEKKKENDRLQAKVSPCYKDAIDRINRIHEKNEEYSIRAAKQLIDKLKLNDKKESNIFQMTTQLAEANAKKYEKYQNKASLDLNDHNHHVQTYGKDLNQSLKAFEHKKSKNQQTKERIDKQLKTKFGNNKNKKERLNFQASETLKKHLDILERTEKAKAQQTISTFYDSSKQWSSRVRMNKSVIYGNEDKKRGRIIYEHFDIRLKNEVQEKVKEAMGSIRHRARKLTQQYK